MLFSSPIFLFGFLPIILLVYFLSPWKFRNAILLTGSLFFYAWGEVFYVLIMVISIFANYSFGVRMDRTGEDTEGRRRRKKLLAYGIGVNLLLLGWFKYANFIFDNLNVMLAWIGIDPIIIKPVHLPLGISFFTFQAISYLVDVYRHDAKAEHSRYRLGLYISLFPQLIAGPIVRYRTIAGQILKREHSIELFSSGAQRFVFGLSKKMLIANPLGEVADSIFAQSAGDLTAPVAWLGILCYTLQIYFDFSGYSDMAIGLGRMFGFRFLENFNYPYIATSIQEFWRRWHISLSTWFRDYLYIPLGGNRLSASRTYFNLIIVFLLCGLWHGASWNFIIWGMIHGFFLILERAWLAQHLNGTMRPLAHVYTLFVVIVAWVFFRTDTLPEAMAYLASMFSPADTSLPLYTITYFMTNEAWIALTIGFILATPIYKTVTEYIASRAGGNAAYEAMLVGTPKVLLMIALLSLSLTKVASSTYNPFIYFRF